ncbi:MAG: DUF4062 domain-containing protein [Bacteroidota bacterium]|nr:DUF4062 domain-containing protein [Bacteroidota bacterium]
MNKRVFISSTFIDLIEYRQAVLEIIRRIGAEDIAMEHFGSRDARPLDECTRLITDETDIFIGIYAHRYGFIPEGSSISVTESEYQAAKQVDVLKLIYIVDPAAIWPVDLIEQGEAASALTKFIAYLNANQITDSFSNKDELAAGIAADIARYLLVGETVSQPDFERVFRLVKDLSNPDLFIVKRAITALTNTRSPWLASLLERLLMGNDEGIAYSALDALRQIPGNESAAVMAAGLQSNFPGIRKMSAFQIGEMALLNRRKNAIFVLDYLIAVVKQPEVYAGLKNEALHSVCKIGTKKAFDFLLAVLREDYPTELKVKALHGPGRFWPSSEFLQFAAAALPVIQQWSNDYKIRLQSDLYFQYIRSPLKEALIAV